MLAGDARFEGFTVSDWTRLVSLFRPRRATVTPPGAAARRGGVFAVHEGGVLRKLVHTELGRLPLHQAPTFPCAPEVLARQNRARYCVVIETGTLEAIMDRFAERTRQDDDVVAQALTMIEALREQLELGCLSVWPRLRLDRPGVTYESLASRLDAVCPANRSVLLGLYDGDELWTSIAARRGPQGFNLLIGPADIRAELGPPQGNFRRQFRSLSRAIEQRCGPLSLGCFAEVSTFRTLWAERKHGPWAKAVALRKVVLSPFPQIPRASPGH